MQIKRKFCNLHGWAPHSVYEGPDGFIEMFCERCYPSGLTPSAEKLARLRGFQLRCGQSAKNFLKEKGWYNDNSRSPS